jgi:predicted O-methyltransferase YrrM
MQVHPPNPSRLRAVATATRRSTLALRLLPRPAARFYVRANLRALRLDDRWNFISALPPRELATLVELARGRKSVVELGTGTAWTSLVLVLSEPGRVVRTYDPNVKLHRAAYVALADAETRARLHLVPGRGEEAEPPPEPVELLYVDSNHSREIVLASFEHWEPHLAPGAYVVFDDYENEAYPGVCEAVADLGLEGETRGRLFVWRR